MRPVIKKIMIAVDFSECTEQSLHYGISLAKGMNASLLLVNVVNSRDLNVVERYIGLQEPELYQKFVEDAHSSRKKELDDLLKIAEEKGVLGDSLVLEGVPYMEILNAIDTEKPDMLIVGTKGRSNIADTIIGSCAQKLYRRCPIPLLSLRPVNHP